MFSFFFFFFFVLRLIEARITCVSEYLLSLARLASQISCRALQIRNKLVSGRAREARIGFPTLNHNGQ